MGRTLPSITQAFLHEQQSLGRFRRALRLQDQRALDDLLAAARQHLAAAAYASHLLPFEVMLLAMLVEEHKRVLHLEVELAKLHQQLARPKPTEDPQAAVARWRLGAQSSAPRDGSVIGPQPEPGDEPAREPEADPGDEGAAERAQDAEPSQGEPAEALGDAEADRDSEQDQVGPESETPDTEGEVGQHQDPLED